MLDDFGSDVQELPSQIEDPRLSQLYDYWLSRKRNRCFPSRRDIDPLDFRYVLGHVMLVDVLCDPLRFRVRLHGSEMVRRASYDLTGKFLDDLPVADYRDYVIDRCKGLVADGKPILVHHNRILDGKLRQYEALWLPFSESGVEVSMLLCALIYDVDWH
jgi:hypothetical protein